MNRIEQLEARLDILQQRLRGIEAVPPESRWRFQHRNGAAPVEVMSDEDIFALACEEVGQDPAAMRSKERRRELSACRVVVAGILARKLDWGIRRIARQMGKTPSSVKKMVDSERLANS